MTVGVHSGDAGYGRYVEDWEPHGEFRAFRHTPLRVVLSADRPPYETMAALVCQGVFDRFPNVRVASIEAGAEWVLPLVKKLKKVYGRCRWASRSDPVETFREHVWVAPYYEDDLGRQGSGGRGAPAVRLGLAPRRRTGRAPDVRRRSAAQGFTDAEIHTVMTDNGRALTRRVP